MHEAPDLVFPKYAHAALCRILSEGPVNCETGMSLFGAAVGDQRVVLALSGPGPRANHAPSHYSADNDFTTEIWRALKCALPGVAWLGELHLHPAGMRRLSRVDRTTIHRILTNDSPDELRPGEFIAGVIQRENGHVTIYPVYFRGPQRGGTPIRCERVASDAPIVRAAREIAGQLKLHEGPKPVETSQQKAASVGAYRRFFDRCSMDLHRPKHALKKAAGIVLTATNACALFAGQLLIASAIGKAFPKIAYLRFLGNIADRVLVLARLK